MLKVLQRSNWLVGALIFFTPILFIFFLASQMGYSQVNSKFAAYQAIPEVSSLADLRTVPPGEVVMVRGQILAATPLGHNPVASDLIIYQEQPTEGREIRYREEFDLVFPDFILELPDGAVVALPSQDRERVIRHTLHTLPDGEMTYAGFRIGDTVTVQGAWQPGDEPLLWDVTGVSSIDKAAMMAEWRSAFGWVGWARNGFGGMTLLGIILLIVQLRRVKREQAIEEAEPWTTTPETTEATTSPI